MHIDKCVHQITIEKRQDKHMLQLDLNYVTINQRKHAGTLEWRCSRDDMDIAIDSRRLHRVFFFELSHNFVRFHYKLSVAFSSSYASATASGFNAQHKYRVCIGLVLIHHHYKHHAIRLWVMPKTNN